MATVKVTEVKWVVARFGLAETLFNRLRKYRRTVYRCVKETIRSRARETERVSKT